MNETQIRILSGFSREVLELGKEAIRVGEVVSAAFLEIGKNITGSKEELQKLNDLIEQVNNG